MHPEPRRLLYIHAGLSPELADLPVGTAEREIGILYRAVPVSDPNWRRMWAAWSATRAARKRLLCQVDQEQYVLEWCEWGMRQ